VAGEYLLKLNISWSPIAYKYREGKLQRTLKRELKELEIANGEGFGRLAVSVNSFVGNLAGRVLRSNIFVVCGVRNVGTDGDIFACRTNLIVAGRMGYREGGFGMGNRSGVRNPVSSDPR